MNEENNELGPKAALWLDSAWMPEYFESLPRAPPSSGRTTFIIISIIIVIMIIAIVAVLCGTNRICSSIAATEIVGDITFYLAVRGSVVCRPFCMWNTTSYCSSRRATECWSCSISLKELYKIKLVVKWRTATDIVYLWQSISCEYLRKGTPPRWVTTKPSRAKLEPVQRFLAAPIQAMCVHPLLR